MRFQPSFNSLYSAFLFTLSSILCPLIYGLIMAPVAALGSDWSTSINPEISLEGQYYTQVQAPDRARPRASIAGKLPFSARNGRTWKFRLLATGAHDPDNVSQEERSYGDLVEAYIQWQLLPITVQIGFNTFAWGVTDGFNPLDVVSPRRYFDPLRSEKLGSASLFIRHDFESGAVEALYIPQQRKTILPGENSRWLPREVFKSASVGTGFGEARIVLPSVLRYHYQDSIALDHALDNNFGLRIKKQFSGLDISIIGFQGAASAPVVNISQISATATSLLPTLTFVVDPDVYLRAAYYKTRVVGASAVLALGDYLVKAESAYTKPVSERSDISKRTVENVLGVERNFSVGSGSLTALVQGTYSDRKDPFDNNSTSLARMFDRAVMLALRWAPNEKLTWLVTGLYDSKYFGNFIHSDASYALSDTVKASVGADFLAGVGETPLGTFTKNDRVILGLAAHW